jgi:endonuclease YncB( thermonuclease family)
MPTFHTRPPLAVEQLGNERPLRIDSGLDGTTSMTRGSPRPVRSCRTPALTRGQLPTDISTETLTSGLTRRHRTGIRVGQIRAGESALSISRPRRIFRPSGVPIGSRSLGLVLLAAAVSAGAVALVALPLHTQSAATPRIAIAPDMLAAQPAQVAVVDAGTLRLKDRVVRLLGVDPPVRGATCQASDGKGFDCGAAATNALAALVRETPVACRLNGHDELGRPFGVCEASGTELNRAVVAAGYARADRSLPALKHDEETARNQRRGLWATARGPSW